MDIGWCHGVAPDKSMFHVDTGIVLVAVVIDTVLFNSSRIQAPLLQSIWVFIPTFRHAIRFDLLFVFSAISLLLLRRSLRLGNWYQHCINDLTATGFETLGPKI